MGLVTVDIELDTSWLSYSMSTSTSFIFFFFSWGWTPQTIENDTFIDEESLYTPKIGFVWVLT